MRLYIGIVKTTAALLLSAAFLVGVAYAVPLPSTPPEVDSTPVSHEDEPEGFRQPQQIQEPIPEPIPEPIQAAPLRALNKTTPKPEPPAAPGGIDTGSVLMMGAAIWYIITLVGIAGGRRGVSRRKRRND